MGVHAMALEAMGSFLHEQLDVRREILVMDDVAKRAVLWATS